VSWRRRGADVFNARNKTAAACDGDHPPPIGMEMAVRRPNQWSAPRRSIYDLVLTILHHAGLQTSFVDIMVGSTRVDTNSTWRAQRSNQMTLTAPGCGMAKSWFRRRDKVQ